MEMYVRSLNDQGAGVCSDLDAIIRGGNVREMTRSVKDTKEIDIKFAKCM